MDTLLDSVSVTLCTRRVVGIMSGVDMQSDVGVPETESESTSSPDFNDQDPGKPEDRRLTEVNGEIGYFVKKGKQFVPVTNFSVTCTGFVTENSESGSSEGFLFHVVPKMTLANGNEEIQEGKRTQYYLTWRDMSTQNGILSKFDSKKLWTVPSKDQYLPSYFKCLCDNYLKETNPRRVYPVECVGLQPNSVPPTWVIGSNLHVHLAGGVTGRLNANDSPYAVLGSEMAPLPLIDIKDEDLDHGVALKELIEIQRLHMGENFVPALLILGGMGMALHYEELSQLYDGVPLIMAYGLPVSGKSLAVQIAMSLIGETKSIGECTQAGMLKLASSRTLPFWWDDVSDFNTLEALTVQTFNQSQKQTAKLEKLNHPRSVPLMTMNPQCLYRKKKVDKEKISRVFTRIAVVPFERISEVQTLKKSLELKAALQPVLRRAVLSVGKLIELRDDFREMKEDPLFLSEISPVLECSALDMRTQLNFALLLYSVGKILDNVALKEHFAKVMSHFSDVIVPHLKSLLENDKSAQLEEYSQSEEELYLDLIHKIVAEASLQPDKTKQFFLPKASMKSKCKCGDVFGFKVAEALKFIAVPEREQALRRFVSETKRGCIGRLTFPGTGQSSGCIHIPRMQLPADMVRTMDEAFSNLKTNPSRSRNVHCNTVQHSVITLSESNVVSVEDEGNSKEGDSDDEKMALDEEVLTRAAEQAEAQERSVTNKKGRKGTGGRNKVSDLFDHLHPGTMSGKRKRVDK